MHRVVHQEFVDGDARSPGFAPGDSKTAIGARASGFDVELSMCMESVQVDLFSEKNNVVVVCPFLESDLPAPASLLGLEYTTRTDNRVESVGRSKEYVRSLRNCPTGRALCGGGTAYHPMYRLSHEERRGRRQLAGSGHQRSACP